MIEDLLAPLAPREPTDAEIERLLARADARRRRRRIRIASGAALATAAATAALAALPSPEEAPVVTAASLLGTTAALAADQPGPPAWTGYRYTRQVWRHKQGSATIERVEEQWTDSAWQGRRSSPRAKVVAGELAPASAAPELPADVRREIAERPAQLSERARSAIAAASVPDPKYVLGARDIQTPRDMPNLYGDAALAKVPLADLPTDADALASLLLESHEDGRWTLYGGWDPVPEAVKYGVLRDILTLLTLANVTPDQRAGLITVLRDYEGVTPLPAVKDHRGREGRGVDIAGIRVIFSPETAEVLEWSEGEDVHTFVVSGHVTRIGDRP